MLPASIKSCKASFFHKLTEDVIILFPLHSNITIIISDFLLQITIIDVNNFPDVVELYFIAVKK